MSDIAVSVRGLGKRYRIVHDREPYARLTETLWNTIRHPLRRGSEAEEFWALRDVTFDVPHGGVVGIIGRNGAGKSTLLKILSRITEPTEGEAVLHGRVSSLLEVGTGFHPELTGRENIYLSGSILGMRRADIRRQFDEIVAFAEVERFLDTPVKRYSSGMQVRLGFAVAAHLEPDILVVDEVLAVGDAAFQKKCLAKMEDVAHGGRTVLFVSHNMAAVARLCERAVLLDRGRVVTHGSAARVVQTYLASDSGRSGVRKWGDPQDAPGDEVARLRSVSAVGAGGGIGDEVEITEPFDVEVEYWSDTPGTLRPAANLHFYNEQGVCLFATSDFANRDWWVTPRGRGLVRSRCRIPGNFLAEGRLTVTVAVSTYNPTRVHAIERDAIAIQIVDRSRGEGVRGEYVNDWPGVIRPMLDWAIDWSSEP